VLWTRAIPYKNDDPTHATNPWCAATPATDGKQVFVWNGSAGATAYDFEGNKLWHRDFGEFVHKWGHASSPRIYYDTVIYFGSPGPRVLLTALNKDTGETVWENHLSEVSSPPEENHGSFVTPYLWKNGVRDELLVPLPGQLASFDPRTGEKLWYCEGLGRLVYADAMLSEDLILAFSGFKGPAIGVRKPRSDETGNLTESHRIWINDKTVQRVGTGIVVGDLFFLCGRKGILQCGDVNSGEIIWEENLRSQAWGSILLQDGLLYLIDQKSETIVFEPADAFKLVARNPMNIKEQSNSTLAFSEGQIFLRTYRALYAIKGN
jgi:outer membrane protein assembly factor BamB